jgi:hypothetical protein
MEKESKARGAQLQKETGEIAAPSSGTRSSSVAIVRPWLPSSESESSEPGKNANLSMHVRTYAIVAYKRV